MLPVPDAEYRERSSRVRDEMSRRGIDTLYVTSPPNIYYLTGFESIWYYGRNPMGVALRRDADEIVIFDYERHRAKVQQSCFFDDAVFYPYATAVGTVSGSLHGRGWDGGTVGLEFWSWAPSGILLDELAGNLRSAGARVADGSWIVDHCRLLKSPAEIASVREASRIADQAIQAAPNMLRPGRTELEIAAQLNLVMAQAGGEEPAIRTVVKAGPQSWAAQHQPPTRRPLEKGDVVFVDVCGVYNRYHVDLARTYALGPRRDAERVLRSAAETVLEVRDTVHPGDPTARAVQIADDRIDREGLRDYVWWIGGYSLGVALPPDWVGHVYLSGEAFERADFQPGYVTNYENIFASREEQWAGGYIDTLLTTDNGIEILSDIPRELTVLD